MEEARARLLPSFEARFASAATEIEERTRQAAREQVAATEAAAAEEGEAMVSPTETSRARRGVAALEGELVQEAVLMEELRASEQASESRIRELRGRPSA